MIKLLSIDLDGTLLNSQGFISQKNLYALKQAEQRGIKIVLCTGRPYLAMKKFVEEINFTGPDDFIITFNGGQIQKAADGEIIQSDRLDLNDMKAWQLELDRLELPMNVVDNSYVYEPLTYPVRYPSLYLADQASAPSKQKDFGSFHPSSYFIKFIVGAEENHLQKQKNKISPALLARYSLTFSYPWLMEISNHGVDKGKALRELSERLAIKRSQVMAVGDQLNDVSMVDYAGTGVAMANADIRVKERADFITKSNDQDGVAYAIHQLLLAQN